MKKLIVRFLLISLLAGAMPAFADGGGDTGGGGGGGGGGGSSGGAGIGIAIGAVVVAGLIGLIVYNASKDKKTEAPKADDPFAPTPAESRADLAPASNPASVGGGIGANKKLEF